MENNITEIDIDQQIDEDIKNMLGENYTLMLYNDSINSFEHVIGCLILYCEHTVEQATQIAYIVHYKGKCDLKHGSWNKLEPICTALLEHNLKAKIEQL